MLIVLMEGSGCLRSTFGLQCVITALGKDLDLCHWSWSCTFFTWERKMFDCTVQNTRSTLSQIHLGPPMQYATIKLLSCLAFALCITNDLSNPMLPFILKGKSVCICPNPLSQNFLVPMNVCSVRTPLPALHPK